jgi:pimeloyl-ACP methyl ester carboxylesterase
MEFASPEIRAPERTTHEFKGWRMEYAIPIRRGPRALVTFHGFARPLEDMFAFSGEVWPEDRTLIAFHLPHHGCSGPMVMSDEPMPPSLLLAAITDILRREGLDTDGADIIGYSIGGRVALSMLVEAPLFWGRTLLMAPDGFVKNPFYRITVHTRFGRWAWHWMDRHAARVLAWNDRLHRWGLISKHLHGFGRFHMESHEMRMMVWHGWRAHRALWPDHAAIAAAFRRREEAGVRTDLVFGKKDQIIPASNAQRIQRQTRGLTHLHFHSILSGHGMLRPDIVSEIIRRIFTL